MISAGSPQKNLYQKSYFVKRVGQIFNFLRLKISQSGREGRIFFQYFGKDSDGTLKSTNVCHCAPLNATELIAVSILVTASASVLQAVPACG